MRAMTASSSPARHSTNEDDEGGERGGGEGEVGARRAFEEEVEEEGGYRCSAFPGLIIRTPDPATPLFKPAPIPSASVQSDPCNTSTASSAAAVDACLRPVLIIPPSSPSRSRFMISMLVLSRGSISLRSVVTPRSIVVVGIVNVVDLDAIFVAA